VTLGEPVTDLRGVLRHALAEAPTVTEFLETLTGEPVVADVMSQTPVAPNPGAGLAVDGEATVVRRIARLRGSSGIPYVCADTVFATARLPTSARRRLEHGGDPIGRVLVEEGLLPVQIPWLGPLPLQDPGSVVPELADVVWQRAYRLALGGRPVFAIREWFLRPVLNALASSEQWRGEGPAPSPSFGQDASIARE
jgi:chorismate-pyruvate lyase